MARFPQASQQANQPTATAGSDSPPGDAAPAGERKAPFASLRGLLPFLARHKGLLVAWLLALIASSTATLSLPVAVRHMIDRGFASGSGIDAAFGLLLAVAVALALATAARFFFVSLLGERVVADLRNQLYGHLIGLDQAFFSRSRSGELVSRLTADTELLRSVVATSMSVALRSTVTVVGGQRGVWWSPAPGWRCGRWSASRSSCCAGAGWPPPAAHLAAVAGPHRRCNALANAPGRGVHGAGTCPRVNTSARLRSRRGHVGRHRAPPHHRAGDGDRGRHHRVFRRDHGGAVVGRTTWPGHHDRGHARPVRAVRAVRRRLVGARAEGSGTNCRKAAAAWGESANCSTNAPWSPPRPRPPPCPGRCAATSRCAT